MNTEFKLTIRPRLPLLRLRRRIVAQDLDAWLPEEVELLAQLGNQRAAAIFEAGAPSPPEAELQVQSELQQSGARPSQHLS
eukprot:SAG11_NODE_9975_length_865_cov_1.244125_1_plen_80_part_10